MICKWCRRLEAEHPEACIECESINSRHEHLVRGKQAAKFAACFVGGSLLYGTDGDFVVYEPDDSPTGKLLAAALELGERAKRGDPLDGDGWWMDWDIRPTTAALYYIHDAERAAGEGE